MLCDNACAIGEGTTNLGVPHCKFDIPIENWCHLHSLSVSWPHRNSDHVATDTTRMHLIGSWASKRRELLTLTWAPSLVPKAWLIFIFPSCVLRVEQAKQGTSDVLQKTIIGSWSLIIVQRIQRFGRPSHVQCKERKHEDCFEWRCWCMAVSDDCNCYTYWAPLCWGQ